MINQIKSEYFKWSSFKIDHQLEGMCIKGRNIIFGGKAGPDTNVSNIIHEMCHFVEIDDKRMISPGWGLKYGTSHSYRDYRGYQMNYDEFISDTPIKRECRVFAYQHSFCVHHGIDSDIEVYADIAHYLPNDSMDIFKKGYPGLSEALAVVLYITELLKKYNYDSFVSEWNRKGIIAHKRLMRRKVD